MSESPRDPVFQNEEGGWCFWDETWTAFYGPYESEEKARASFAAYCRDVLGA